LSAVIIVGGGAYALAQTIKDGLFTHATTRNDPEYANARGMLKMGMRSYIQSQAQA